MLQLRADMDKVIDKIKHDYKEEHESLLYITDHALVRHAQRVNGAEATDIPDIDAVRFLYHDQCIEEVRNNMLSRTEQEFIIDKNLKQYNQGDITYVIKNLAVVTVYMRNNSKANKHTEPS